MKNAEILHKLVWLVAFVSLVGQASSSSEPKYPLERAARDGDVEGTKRLLAEGQSQYLRDSALTFAIQAGHREIMELLISGGARYALMKAAEQGDAQLVEDLLTRGQGTDERDSALHAAVRTGHKEVVELLLSQGANVDALRWGDFTPLFFAVTAGGDFNALSRFKTFPLFPGSVQLTGTKHSSVAPERYIDIIELLVKHGADINFRDKQHGFVPLHYAIFGGNVEIVKALLDRGAQVDPAIQSPRLSNRYIAPLHLAAYYGDLTICELLVQRGADVNSKMPPGTGVWTPNARQTPLHFAVCSGNAKLVGLLIDHGAEVNAADSKDETPLHLAAEHGGQAILETLLSHGAEVNAVDSEGQTPLHHAVERKDRPLVDILLSHGADANRKNQRGQTPMSIATQNGSDEIVKLLLARHGQITIHSAANVGDIEAMERLVKSGVSVNRIDIQGRTALHAAVAAGQVRTVEWLIAHGANVNLADDEEATALSLALGIAQGYSDSQDPNEVARFKALTDKQRDIIASLICHGARLPFVLGIPQDTVLTHSMEVAQLLIDAGPNLEPGGDDKATLLHRAAWWGNRKAVEGLIELGADLNAADRLGGTPLHAALQSGCTRYWDVITGPHPDVLQLLIEHSADVNAGNNQKATPLHGAAGCGHAEAIKLLLNHGAKVDAVTSGNATPLHCAAGRGSIEAMKLLIAAGADPNARDDEGDTPLLLLLSRYALLRDEAAEPAKDFALKLVRQGVQVEVRNKEGVTPLQEAAALGFPDLLEEMLTRGAPVNQASTTGWTALHSAVARGEPKCVEMLLERGAPVNGLGRLPGMVRLASFDWPARTPLHIAAAQGSNAIVRMLLEHGADVNARDGNGKTPLHLARESNRLETIRLLSSRGADPDIPVAEPWISGRRSLSPIAQAQAKRELGTVESLAPKAPAALLTNLLFQEAEDGYSELIPVLAAHGADVNAHESLRQETPLHRAVNKKNLKAIGLLLAQGADINSKDKNGETPLGAAVFRGQKETVSLLLSHGADVNAAYRKECEFRGAIPLHIAVRWGHLEIARMLVLKGANVNAVGLWEGLTPLHMAVKDRALLELMLEHGGQIDNRSTGGTTCLHLAAQAGQDDLVRYLIAKGASVNIRDRNGDTPLHLAAKTGQRASCKILVAEKADANLRNNKGLLPVDYAEASGIEAVFADGRAAP
jgi:ankyrin repeat protein